MPVYLSLFSLDTDRPGNVGWATSKSGLMDEARRGKEPLPGLGEEGGRRQQGRDAGMQWGVLRAWLWGAFLLPGLHQLHGKGSSWCSSRAQESGPCRSWRFLAEPGLSWKNPRSQEQHPCCQGAGVFLHLCCFPELFIQFKIPFFPIHFVTFP